MTNLWRDDKMATRYKILELWEIILTNDINVWVICIYIDGDWGHMYGKMEISRFLPSETGWIFMMSPQMGKTEGEMRWGDGWKFGRLINYYHALLSFTTHGKSVYYSIILVTVSLG